MTAAGPAQQQKQQHQPQQDIIAHRERLDHWTRWLVVAAWAIVLIGAGLRARAWLAERSLWRDESSLSYNLVTKDWHALLRETLDFNQAAPVGFLIVEKLAVLGIGTDERALRLVPLIGSLVALVLFYRVARRILGPVGTLAGLAILAISPQLIYYAAEVKQFGLDVMWVLAILLCALRYHQDGRTVGQLLMLSVVGLVAIFFSHPAIFVLAGVGAAIFVDAWLRRDPKTMGSIVPAGLAWVVAFGLNWWFFLRMVSAHPYLRDYWRTKEIGFPPIPEFTRDPKWIRWYVETFFDLFNNVMGLPKQIGDHLSFAAAALVAAAVFIGVSRLWRSERRLLMLIGLPVVFALLASVVRQYPFQQRMILFCVPILALLAAGGITAVWRHAGPFKVPAGVAMLVAMLIYPAYVSGYRFLQPALREEFRPIIEHTMKNLQPGDVIYLYEGSERAFHYYTSAFDSFKVPDGVTVIRGPVEGQNWSVYRDDLQQLEGKPRVWVLFTHIYKWGGVDEHRLHVHYLNEMGQQKDMVGAREAYGYLYDLSGAPQ